MEWKTQELKTTVGQLSLLGTDNSVTIINKEIAEGENKQRCRH
jgi:hypothetical protein